MFKFLPIIISILFCTTVFADRSSKFTWKELSNQDDIIVYQANENHKSGLIPLKVKATLDYSIDKVCSVLENSTRKKEWVPYFDWSKYVKVDSAYSRIEHTVYDFPWPIKDREFLLQLKITVEKENKRIYVDLVSTEDNSIPLNQKYERAHTYDGHVEANVISKNKTQLEMYFLSDIKGAVPKWMINIISKSWPRELIILLKKQLAKNDIQINPIFIMDE